MKKIILAILAFSSVAHASYYCEVYQNESLIEIKTSSAPYATGVIGRMTETVSMIYHTATTGLEGEKPSLHIWNSKTGEKATEYGSLKDPNRQVELMFQDFKVKCSTEKLNQE